MASRPGSDVVELVRRLRESKQAFSITLEHPDSPAVRSARLHGHDFNFTAGDNDGDCIQWMEVPGVGLVCVKHRGT